MRKLLPLLLALLLFPLSIRADEPRDELIHLLHAVMSATESKDLPALREILPAHFKYSFGGDDTRDGAIRYWKDNPGKLEVLGSMLSQGCLVKDTYATCPPQNGMHDVIYFGPRAGFERRDGQWYFTFFVEGD